MILCAVDMGQALQKNSRTYVKDCQGKIFVFRPKDICAIHSGVVSSVYDTTNPHMTGQVDRKVAGVNVIMKSGAVVFLEKPGEEAVKALSAMV